MSSEYLDIESLLKKDHPLLKEFIYAANACLQGRSFRPDERYKQAAVRLREMETRELMKYGRLLDSLAESGSDLLRRIRDAYAKDLKDRLIPD
ncbi:MAG: hypothetical protein QW165_04215 [Candidatus Woesearchaeota archaeon]